MDLIFRYLISKKDRIKGIKMYIELSKSELEELKFLKKFLPIFIIKRML